jgi:hypothetical protein
VKDLVRLMLNRRRISCSCSACVALCSVIVHLYIYIYIYIYIQWNVEPRTQSVPGDGSTFKLFDFQVKFPHKK